MSDVQYRNVSFSYPNGDRPTLTGLDLTVESGQMVCVLGQSGSGKSTILHLLAGLLRPDEGDICVGGTSVVSIAPHRRRVTLLSQNALLFPFTTVAGNVEFAPKLRGVSRAKRAKRVGSLLELVGLSGFEKRPPQSLSGGEAQRVALARALAADPEVLLMDEPFSSLDAPIRRDLQQSFADLHERQRLTTIFVTHQVDEAMALGDRVAGLVNGRLEAVDIPDVVYERPPSSGVARLVGVERWLAGRWDRTTLRGAWGEVAVAESPQDGDWGVAARPERLSVVSAVQDSSGLVGRVFSAVYRGSYWELMVRLDGGAELVVHQDHHLVAPPHQVGDAVNVVGEQGSWFPLRISSERI